MTPTPRTDERVNSWESTDGQWVNAEFAREIERELAAERALADRLAETLANVQGDYATTGAITTPEVDTALTAWKEARK